MCVFPLFFFFFIVSFFISQIVEQFSRSAVRSSVDTGKLEEMAQELSRAKVRAAHFEKRAQALEKERNDLRDERSRKSSEDELNRAYLEAQAREKGLEEGKLIGLAEADSRVASTYRQGILDGVAHVKTLFPDIPISGEEVADGLRVAVGSPHREAHGGYDDDSLFLDDADGSPGFDD